MINKDKLKRRFSRNAKQYDQYAHVQKIMGNTLVKSIDRTQPVNNILEIGCGTGYVTRQLAETYPNATITAVDIASGMIEVARQSLDSDKVTFICADAETMDFDNSYDLIVSNATFQWFNHFEDTFEKLVGLLSENGQMHFSTFGEQTFNELHSSFKVVKNQMNITDDLKPGQTFYNRNELKNKCAIILDIYGPTFSIVDSESLEPEFFTSCQDFLISVKKIGANNAQQNKTRVHPEFIQNVMAYYDETYRKDGQVKATYHTLFFSILK